MYYDYRYHGYPGYPQYYYYPGYHPSRNHMGHYHNHHYWDGNHNGNDQYDEYNNEYQQNNQNYDNNYDYENNYHNMYNQEENEEYYNNNYQQNENNYNNNDQYIQNGREEGNNNNKEKGKSEKEKKKTNDELILDYENSIRKEIEETTPLISEDFNITILIDEYKSNEEYIKNIENICKKYKSIRKVRRDGNCFYRCFIFRLFEHICIKNDKILFEKIKQKIIDAKELTGKNGYDWVVVEDFYDLFLKEFTNCFNCLTDKTTVRDYLDTLFKDKKRTISIGY